MNALLPRKRDDETRTEPASPMTTKTQSVRVLLEAAAAAAVAVAGNKELLKLSVSLDSQLEIPPFLLLRVLV